ncbi:MAG: hypothetical protein P1V20_29110 [Verrucomicrobiales bacterium]|nr:hypothetical protein [Verrucomicrobiales bacterium]
MSDQENLYQSYRQSLRELKCIVSAWAVFALWNVSAGALLAYKLPDPGEPLATVIGIPQWAFFTVLLPWIAGNIFIIWFAVRFMKDTDTVSGEERDDS